MKGRRPSRTIKDDAHFARCIERMLADGTLMSDDEWAADRRVQPSLPSSLTGFYRGSADAGTTRRRAHPSPTEAAVSAYYGAGKRVRRPTNARYLDLRARHD
jgi:hypothetical protein